MREELISFARKFGAADPEATVKTAYEHLEQCPKTRDKRRFLYVAVVRLVRAAR